MALRNVHMQESRDEIKRRRVWKRQWRYQKLAPTYYQSVPFGMRTSDWPDIEIYSVPPEEFEFETGIYEIEFIIDAGTARRLHIDVFGEYLVWDAALSRLISGRQSMYVAQDDGIVRICLYMTESDCIIGNDTESARLERTDPGSRDITVTAEYAVSGSFAGRNDGVLVSLTVYGVRPPDYPQEIKNMICPSGNPRIVYEEDGYRIEADHLSDDAYGKPDAYVPDPYTIISARRVMEEFEWRHTPMGDMTRSINRGNIWKGEKYPFYPEILTGIPAVDAAYHVALNVLHDACGDKYALPGEAGMWSGGAFQGPGEGFGVWKRDTMQILLRGGALLDPEASAGTLRYIMHNGNDNAVDGIPTPVISCMDYYLATHDLRLINELWPDICEKLSEADRYYDPEAGLMRAAHSSANDAFADEDSGGYALSTEIYFMDAYRTAAVFARMLDPEKEQVYTDRAEKLLDSIRAKYWNPRYGYFTSGPEGSRAYREGIWESCGVEASVLKRFCVADRQQRQSTIRILKDRIITKYGIPLMPGHIEKNHLTQAAWPVYYTGFIQSASQEGDRKLVMRLIAQQVRNAVFQKTFYEVLDTQTGENWRWPGQTWHAAGYVSMLLCGVFGMDITEQGISFCPCIPDELQGIHIENLRYCGMILQVRTQGCGMGSRFLLDGKETDRIRWDLTGRHEVLLICENRE